MALSRAQIQTAFQNSLGRAASASDENSYFSVSQSGALTDTQIFTSISNSREADIVADPVIRFYQAAFGRVPDQQGLVQFENFIRQNGSTLATYTAVANTFVASQEFTNRFGTGTAVDAAYVQALYSTILGRSASNAEVDGYVSGAAGYTTRAGVLYAVSQSNEANAISNDAVNGFQLNAARGQAVYQGTLYTPQNGSTGGLAAVALTTGVDSLVGTSSNDSFTGIIGTNATFQGLDKVDGGIGTDTLTLTHTTGGDLVLPAGVTVTNVENLVLRNSLGTVGASGAGANDVSGYTGLQSVTIEQLAASTVGLSTKANVTTVAVTGGTTVDIADLGTGTTAGTKDVLSTVSFSGNTSAATVASDALTSLSIKDTNQNATVTATAGTRALTVNLDNVGTGGTVSDVTATSVTVNTVNTTANATTPGSTINLTLDAATTLTFTGDKAVTVTTLTDSGVDVATLATIDASRDTGGVTIGSTLALGTAFTGGTGNDAVTVGATTKAISLGAGDDTVTVTGALGTGGSLDGGTGTNAVAATAANAATLTANNTFAGKIANFQQLSITDSAAAQTAINLANLNNINYVKSAGTSTGGTAEFTDIAFTTLNPGQSVTVAGQTVTASGGTLTAAQVEAAFISGASAGNAVVSGTLNNYAASGGVTPADGTARFTSTVAGNVTPNLTATAAGAAPPAAPTVATVADGNTTSTAETQNVTFTALTAGQSVTVAGLTLTSNGTAAASAVEAAFIASSTGAAPAGFTKAGTLTGFTAGAGTPADGVVLLTGTDFANVGPAATSSNGTPAPGAQTANTTEGVAGAGLNITNFTSGGTLELTGAIQGASFITVANAANSTTDVFNIKINGAANIINTGATTIAQVETINITTADTTASSDPSAASKVFLSAVDATTVTVTGNHGVDFSGSTLSNLTTLNASGVAATGTAAVAGTAGAITFTSTVANKSLTLSTGNGNDVLDASSVTDATKVVTINAGAGNDTITGGTGADSLTGGTGNDVFKYTAIAQSTIARTDTITDFQANTFGNGTSGAAGTGAAVANQASFNGDVIDLRSVLAGGSTKVSSFNANSAADAQTFLQNNAAVAGNTDTAGAALDATTGNVYVDVDHNGTADMVIKLQGVTAVTNAAFLVG